MARVRSDEYDDKRLSILERAASLFARHGFARTSISQLSKECNASKAWIYHYYESKEAILFDILDSHIRMLLDTVRRADDPGAEPVERLRRLIGALLRAYRHADDKHKVQLNDMGILPEEQQAHIKAMEREIVAIFAKALVAINPALEGNRRLLKPVTMSLMGILNWHYTWWREGGPLGLDEYVDLATNFIVNGVRGLR